MGIFNPFFGWEDTCIKRRVAATPRFCSILTSRGLDKATMNKAYEWFPRRSCNSLKSHKTDTTIKQFRFHCIFSSPLKTSLVQHFIFNFACSRIWNYNTTISTTLNWQIFYLNWSYFLNLFWKTNLDKYKLLKFIKFL